MSDKHIKYIIPFSVFMKWKMVCKEIKGGKVLGCSLRKDGKEVLIVNALEDGSVALEATTVAIENPWKDEVEIFVKDKKPFGMGKIITLWTEPTKDIKEIIEREKHRLGRGIYKIRVDSKELLKI